MDFTIGIPVRNRILFANQAIECALNHCEYPIIIIDDCSDKPDGIYIQNERVKIIYNTEKKGLTALWNQILNESKTEYVILMGDKLRPKEKDFFIIEENLKLGFGIVATYMLGIFGFSKFLTTKIGLFDEGFKSGGFEDTDTMNKLFANNIALYFSDETEYIKIPSNWNSDNSNETYYKTKWIEDLENRNLIQIKSDFNHQEKNNFSNFYNQNIPYLEWSKSKLLCENVINYYKNLKYIKNYEN